MNSLRANLLFSILFPKPGAWLSLLNEWFQSQERWAQSQDTGHVYLPVCELGSEAEHPWGHGALSGCPAGCKLCSRKRQEASCEPWQEASKREASWRSRVRTSWMSGSHGWLPAPPSCPCCLQVDFPAFSLTPEIQPLHDWCGVTHVMGTKQCPNRLEQNVEKPHFAPGEKKHIKLEGRGK